VNLEKGLFITFEGPDGSGKTTQAEKLTAYLEGQGFPVTMTREPGGTVLAEKLREILLDPQNHIVPLSELLMYGASRAQHTQEIIIPALDRNVIVICQRYSDATLAYQGFGRGLDVDQVKEINRISSGGLVPDLTILLDIDITEGLKRRESKTLDRLEKEAISFHERVRKGYLETARIFPERIKTIEVTSDIETTFQEVTSLVQVFLNRIVKKTLQ